MNDPARPFVPEFIILTGALGSGKTTLLSAYLSSGDMASTGVIVNDAGEINVDGAIIASDNRDLAIATLSDGCICCSMGNSLQEGIDALLEARAARRLGPVTRIILETSGLAEPGPILRSLRQVRQQDFRVRIIATFDSSDRKREFLPQYAAQLAAAQTIVVTKVDAVPETSLADSVAGARSFNPLANILAEGTLVERAMGAFEADGGQASMPSGFQIAVDANDTRISTAMVRWRDEGSWEELGDWIENVSGYFDNRLLRMKGLVRPRGFKKAILVNGVGGVFSPPRPVEVADDVSLGLILILRDIDPGEFSIAAPPPPAMELTFR